MKDKVKIKIAEGSQRIRMSKYDIEIKNFGKSEC